MSDGSSKRHLDTRTVGVGVALLILAAIILRDAFGQTIRATYGVGPAVMPMIVSGLLGILAIGHFVVAFREGLPEAPVADRFAVIWIGLGMAALVLGIAFGGGFMIASTLLFAATARAFGRRAAIMDIAIGLAIAVAVHLIFSKFLTLSLPAGPLERLI